MKEYVIDGVRIQALSDDIVRIEQAENGRFNDADTFFVPDKAQYRKIGRASCRERVSLCV